ncbi:MAG: hypothetical protein AB1505_20560 [Candidatus Latescibacterota bacterium]
MKGTGRVRPEAQKGLEDYKLQSEVLNPVHAKLTAEVSDLEVQRASLEGHRAYYRGQKEQQEQLRRELAGLRQEVAYLAERFEGWGGDVRAVAATVDSLDLQRTRLERNIAVYQETFQRFARLQEEARIAREQAAGDIQVVSRVTLPHAVARGTVKRAGIGGVAGLMLTVFGAFFLEYVRKAHGRQAEAA